MICEKVSHLRHSDCGFSYREICFSHSFRRNTKSPLQVFGHKENVQRKNAANHIHGTIVCDRRRWSRNTEYSDLYAWREQYCETETATSIPEIPQGKRQKYQVHFQTTTGRQFLNFQVKNIGSELKTIPQLMNDKQADESELIVTEETALRNVSLQKHSAIPNSTIWWEVLEVCDDKIYRDLFVNLPHSDCKKNLVLYTLSDKLFPETLSIFTAGG